MSYPIPASKSVLRVPNSQAIAPSPPLQQHKPQENKEVFIPGSLKEDSLEDRLFFQLYSTAKVDAFALCQNSETWEKPDDFQEKEKKDILEFIEEKISHTCSDNSLNKTLSSTIDLKTLFLNLYKKMPGNFYFFGSHLQEIASRYGWDLNNLKKILKDTADFKSLEARNAVISGDSDWRFFPDRKISKQDLVGLTQYVIDFFAISIYRPQGSIYPIPKGPTEKFSTKCDNVKNSSFSKLNCFDSRDNDKGNTKKNHTIYATLSFGSKKPIDLMFVQEMQNLCLFNLDDLTLSVNQLLNLPSKQKSTPKSSTSQNVWQQIVDRFLYILHCPNTAACDETGWLRALKHLTKGGRFFQDGVESDLFDKLNPATLPYVISRYFTKLKGAETSSLIALYFHLLIFVNKKKVDEKIIQTIQEKIIPQFLQIGKPIHLLEHLFVAMQDKTLPFHLVYQLVHSVCFLNMATASTKVSITRYGSKPAFRISDPFYIYTQGSLVLSINDLEAFLLKTVDTLSNETLQKLENLMDHLIPNEPYRDMVNESLKTRLSLFDLEWKAIPPMAEKLLNSKNSLLQKYGYNLLLSCFCYHNNQQRITEKILTYFPLILEQEPRKEERTRLMVSIIQIFSPTVFLTLNPIFDQLAKKEHHTTLNYLHLCIAHLDPVCCSLIAKVWLNLNAGSETKKTTGVPLLEKTLKLDFKVAVNLFQYLLQNVDLTELQISHFYKQFVLHCKTETSLENLLSLKKLNELIFPKIESENLNSIKQELFFLIRQFFKSRLLDEAKDLLLFGIHHKLISLDPSTDDKPSDENFTLQEIDDEILNQWLPPNLTFQYDFNRLKNEILQKNLPNSLTELKKILEIQKTEQESLLLRQSICHLFQTFCTHPQFANLYPFLLNNTFLELFSANFDQQLGIYCHYLELSSKPKIEIPKILIFLFSEVKNLADLKVSSKNMKRLTEIIIHFLNDQQNQIHPKMKELLIEHSTIILNNLHLCKEHLLFIDFLTVLKLRRIDLSMEPQVVEPILKVFEEEMASPAQIKKKEIYLKIGQLFLILKLHTFNESKFWNRIKALFPIVISAHAALKEKILVKELLKNLFKSEEPDENAITLCFLIFDDLQEAGLVLIEGLVHHLGRIENHQSTFEKFLFVLNVVNERSTNIEQNLQLEFTAFIMAINKLLASKHPILFLTACGIFDQFTSENFAPCLASDPNCEELAKVITALIAESDRARLDTNDIFISHLTRILMNILKGTPEFLYSHHAIAIFEQMIKVRSLATHILCTQIHFMMITSLQKRAPEVFLQLTTKVLRKIINEPLYFDITANTPTPLEDILWKFVNFKNSSLHFKEDVRTEVIGKILLYRMEGAARIHDLIGVSQTLTTVIEFLPIICDYPSLQDAVLNKALDLLVIALQQNKIDYFDFFIFNLLSHITGNDLAVTFKTPPSFDCDQIQNLDRFLHYQFMLSHKILNAQFSGNRTQISAIIVLHQQVFLLLNVYEKKQQQLKSASNKKELQLRLNNDQKKILEIVEKLIFFPPAQTTTGIVPHLNELAKIDAEINRLKLCEPNFKLNKILKLYRNLNPLELLDVKGGMAPESIMGEVLSMIKTLLKFNSSILLIRPITLYQNIQSVQIPYLYQNKKKDVVEPQKLLECFKEIQKTFETNPFFEEYITQEEGNDQIALQGKSKDNYIFYYFQKIILENPYTIKHTRSVAWDIFLAQSCSLWSFTLIHLYQKNHSEKIGTILFEALYEFISLSKETNCFFQHTDIYLSAIKDFFTCFSIQVNFLKFDEKQLSQFLTFYKVASLFDLGKQFSKPENATISSMLLGLLRDLKKIDSKLVQPYIEKQLETAQIRKILPQPEINALKQKLSS